MTYTPAIVPRAIDPDVLVDGARAALESDATVLPLVTAAGDPPSKARIAKEAAPEGTRSPYVVLDLPSVVYGSTYGKPGINALMDVSCYAEGWDDRPVRALATACLGALIDTAWTAAGLTMIAVTMEESGAGFRRMTELVGGEMIRGRQFTIRVHAFKT